LEQYFYLMKKIVDALDLLEWKVVDEFREEP
jgi:hypothetical protein